MVVLNFIEKKPLNAINNYYGRGLKANKKKIHVKNYVSIVKIAVGQPQADAPWDFLKNNIVHAFCFIIKKLSTKFYRRILISEMSVVAPGKLETGETPLFWTNNFHIQRAISIILHSYCFFMRTKLCAVRRLMQTKKCNAESRSIKFVFWSDR